MMGTSIPFIVIENNTHIKLLTREWGLPARRVRTKIGIAEWSYESERNRYFLKLQIMNE
jgi:hypothetical protein